MLITQKTLQKIERLVKVYEEKIFNPLLEIKNFNIFECEEHLRSVPNDTKKDISLPYNWGGVWTNTWFKTSLQVDQGLTGKKLYIQPQTAGRETMLWVNDQAKGIISKELEVGARGYHHTLYIGDSFQEGQSIDIALECYAGHPCIGCHPGDEREFTTFTTEEYEHTFKSCFILERDELIKDFVFDLKTLLQITQHLPEESFRKGSTASCLEKVFALVSQAPEDLQSPILRKTLEAACSVMEPELSKKNSPSAPIAGIIGHSHMDTAWLWTTQETQRKCARTFSNALNLMDQYPEYMFLQSSVLHLEDIKSNYPQIFQQIKQRVAEGRWEPNGASYVEADGNITGGEAQIRQFTRGIKFLKDEFNYTPDSYWLPDTFGYNAALPQIIKGCGLKYFLTTKLSWNESNTFPYDSFKWQGIDGSEVVAHFNETHCWPDPQTLLSRLNGLEEGKYTGNKFSIRHKDIADKRFIAYGFGDGGGGPMYEMLEMARRCEDLEGIPKAQHMTLTKFMDQMVETCPNLPEHRGELYLELHRGTLTHQHKIKRYNRKLEVALRLLDYLNVKQRLAGQSGISQDSLDALWKTLLVNQFHDILPGTSIPEVHDLAIEQYEQAMEACRELAQIPAVYSAGEFSLLNSLNWKRNDYFSIPVNQLQLVATGVNSESFCDVKGQKQLLIENSSDAFSSRTIELAESAKEGSSSFSIAEKITTPFYEFTLSKDGKIKDIFSTKHQRRLTKENQAFNEFLIGEDIPALWDSWDIDFDQQVKMEASAEHISTEIVKNGELHLRIRSEFKIGQNSKITQDIVFYQNSERIDFETLVDWNEMHQLLQTSFDLDVFSNSIKCEIPFGYIERPTHNNSMVDRACFEFSQHKYSDISETRFGIAFLNDGKYAIDANGSRVKLSLVKSGGHPDPRGDKGQHFMVYSLLPHEGQLSSENVIRPAYELNHPPVLLPIEHNYNDKFCEVSESNIIVESLKWADDESGYVLRIYEAEGSTTRCKAKFNFAGSAIHECNMLEDELSSLTSTNGQIELHFHPFEIKTIKVKS
ncbi:glycoside hydrolase family 38 C-terminal domain-containing protein [Lentisphaera marina]|uniref:alpha-mannosidase n=1 Tax=Lentisphaera marina TaxID=1111041 RepID=UPI0023672B4A|nr:glycoside hydrolase family 38 C-terminal domain-containing protein [Lentisphaera marina]MDD7986552.1 glycoside hydrolase family 38 C-terminal domain-containing protein [Lentisphaera marina]